MKLLFLIPLLLLVPFSSLADQWTPNYYPTQGNIPVNAGFKTGWTMPSDNFGIRCFSFSGLDNKTIHSIQGGISITNNNHGTALPSNDVYSNALRISLIPIHIQSPTTSRTTFLPCQQDNGTVVNEDFINNNGIRILNSFCYTDPNQKVGMGIIRNTDMNIYVPTGYYVVIWSMVGDAVYPTPYSNYEEMYSSLEIYAS